MIGNNLGKGGLSRPRRPEKDNGRKPICLNGSS